jgi:hypothetical protein
MLHKGLFADSEKKCVFHIATFVLRSVWANQHNSWQGYNLDKLINQSELTHDLAANTRNEGPCKSSLGLQWLSLKFDIAMCRQGMLWFQNNKDKLLKVMIGLAEPMRGATRPGAFDEPKEWKDWQCGSKEFKMAPRLYTRNSGFKGIHP